MDFKFDDYLNSNKGKLNPGKAEEIEVNSEENKIQKIAEKLVFNKKSLTKEEIEFYRNNPREIDKKYNEISDNAHRGITQDPFKKGVGKIKNFFSNFTKKNKNNLETEKEDDATIGEPSPKEEDPIQSEAPSVSDIEKEKIKTELLQKQAELLRDKKESEEKILEQTIVVSSLTKEQLEDQIQLNNFEIKKLRILITEAEKSNNEPEVLKLETEIRVLEEKQNEIKNKLMETEKVLFFNSKMKELRILLSEAEKSNNEPEVLKLENEIRDLENIQNPKQKITEEKIEQSKTPPPIPKPREKVEYQSLLIYNNLSRKEYFDFKNLKPKNVNPEYAKEYQEQLILKEKAYRESKNKIVTALVMEGRQQEAKEFLMHEVEIKRKNDVENGGLGPKIKQGISNGIEAWDKWGVEHTDKEGNLVKGNVLKRLAKMGVSMTLIGLTASWSVEKLANIGGTATALDGGTTSYLLNKLKIGLGLGAIMETIPPKHKKWVGKLVTMTVIAGGATLAIAGGGLMAGMAVGASSAVGYGLSKLAQGRFSEKKIDERAEKMKTDNTINVENIEEDSAEFERQAEEAIIKAENTRLKRKLAGATAALVGSVATLELSGMVRDHQNELTESENIKNQEINTVEESTVERYVTVGNGDGVTQALSELNKGGAVPSWFNAELGPNPTPSELAQFAKDIDTYRPDNPEDSLVLLKGDSLGFKNDCLVLDRGGETFILAKPDGQGGFIQGDWQEQMINEKFMDTIDTMQEKEAHENQLASDLNSQTEQAPSTSPMIDDNTMPYEPVTTKPIAPMNAGENTNTDENKINTNPKDVKDETIKENEKIVRKTSNNGDYKAKVDYTAKGAYSLGDRQQNIPVDRLEHNSNNYDDKNYEPQKYEGHLYYKLNPGEVLAMQKMEAHNMRELLSTEESMDLWNKIKDSHTTTNAATIIAMDRDSIGDPNMLKLHDHFVDIKEETGVNPFDGKKYLSPQEFFDKGHQNAADHHILRKIKL